MFNQSVAAGGNPSLLATHSVLRNTYLLLSITLLFSALTAFFGLMHPTFMNPLLSMVLMFGLLFLVQATSRSSMGILSTFLFTGFMGYTLGPLLHMAVASFANGPALIMTALGATGLVFLALSAYVMLTQKDFSFMGGVLFAGLIIALVASLMAMVFGFPMLQLVVSGVFALLSSGLILFHTSQIIHGGERNYILATVSLYVALFNLFVSLLQIFMAFAGDRD